MTTAILVIIMRHQYSHRATIKHSELKQSPQYVPVGIDVGHWLELSML
jgi:hypothetical protein